MMDFYRPAKANGSPVPGILGLTASPIIGTKIEGMDELESTLDARCQTPTVHRKELISRINRPEIRAVTYPITSPMSPNHESNIARFRRTYNQLDIKKDPYALHLLAQYREQRTDDAERKLRDTIVGGKTPSQELFTRIFRKSGEIYRQLGSWAAEYYLYHVIQRLLKPAAMTSEGLIGSERRYQQAVLQTVGAKAPPSKPTLATDVSPKVHRLIQILSEYEGDATAIIFATERVTTTVLANLLSILLERHGRYRVGAIVGTSVDAKRMFDVDLWDSSDAAALDHFRTGKVNLLVATSVLEEGIDIPICNLIVCLEKPPNLKSFIQRRGRARAQSAWLYLMLEDGAHASIQQFQALENAMKQRYEDEMREVKAIAALEDSDPDGPFVLEVPETGARLPMSEAKGHLQHFCATLSSRKFVNLAPEYLIDRDSEEGRLRATVILPACLQVTLRRVNGQRSWNTEKNACNDAAFQAYKLLYEAGLLDKNLLPLRESDLSRDVGERPGLATVRERYNPWFDVANSWRDPERAIHFCRLAMSRPNAPSCDLRLLLPVPIPQIQPVPLYWKTDSTVPWTIRVHQERPEAIRPTELPPNVVEQTAALVNLAFGYRWPIPDQHNLLRFYCEGVSLDFGEIGSRPFTPSLPGNSEIPSIVRDASNRPYIWHREWLPSKPPLDMIRHIPNGYEDMPQNEPFLVVEAWPKTTGLFNPVVLGPAAEQSTPSKPYPRILPARDARFDEIPLSLQQFSCLVPSFTHVVELHLVAAKLLSSTKLGEVGISNISLVVAALCAPSAREVMNYERLEFLGDSLLKLCATINCAAQSTFDRRLIRRSKLLTSGSDLHYPEGYLSLLKDKIVSNTRLWKVAVDFTLDRYINTAQFKIATWRHLYEAAHLTSDIGNVEETRTLSTKLLADVVEALIGACFVEGGIDMALRCISILIVDVRWMPFASARQRLFDNMSPFEPLPPYFQPLEDFIGYTFQRKSILVEAFTHSSYLSTQATGCLERLEFIGDAVLDYVVVQGLRSAGLSHIDMHLMKTCLVNADFLAFLALEWRTISLFPSYDTTIEDGETVITTGSPTETPLWRFMRHNVIELAAEGLAAERRHASVRADISQALEAGEAYPWALLARLRAPKFLSDVVEALIGAIWVDSGDFAAVERVLERTGLATYLTRLVSGGVRALHPKEELGHLADTERVEYVVETVTVEDGPAPLGGLSAEVEFGCTVVVGRRKVVTVRGGVGRDEVRTKAADAAVEILRAEREGMKLEST
jgi:dsRNA-specific ribonuclease